jgi:hypothetical protein
MRDEPEDLPKELQRYARALESDDAAQAGCTTRREHAAQLDVSEARFPIVPRPRPERRGFEEGDAQPRDDPELSGPGRFPEAELSQVDWHEGLESSCVGEIVVEPPPSRLAVALSRVTLHSGLIGLLLWRPISRRDAYASPSRVSDSFVCVWAETDVADRGSAATHRSH